MSVLRNHRSRRRPFILKRLVFQNVGLNFPRTSFIRIDSRKTLKAANAASSKLLRSLLCLLQRIFATRFDRPIVFGSVGHQGNPCTVISSPSNKQRETTCSRLILSSQSPNGVAQQPDAPAFCWTDIQLSPVRQQLIIATLSQSTSVLESRRSSEPVCVP